MSHLSRPPRGQQRDKPYREAYAWRLAAAGEDLMALRELAKAHIAKCKEGSRQSQRAGGGRALPLRMRRRIPHSARRASPPEILEAIRRKLGVANRVLDVLVPEPSLQRPGVVAGVR